MEAMRTAGPLSMTTRTDLFRMRPGVTGIGP